MSAWVKSSFRELTKPNLLIMITAVLCDEISIRPACAVFSWEDWMMFVPASWSQGLLKAVNSFMLLSLVRKARKRPNRPPASWCGPSLRLVNSSLLWSSKTSCVCVCVWPHCRAFTILVPQPGIEHGLYQWKRGVITTGPPGNSCVPKLYLWILLFSNTQSATANGTRNKTRGEISLANSGPSSFRTWVHGKKSHSFRFSQVLNTADSSEIF